jgi:hypothetical protein
MSQCDLEQNEPGFAVILADEDGRNRLVLPWRNAAKVDERYLQIVGRPQRAVVSLLG